MKKNLKISFAFLLFATCLGYGLFRHYNRLQMEKKFVEHVLIRERAIYTLLGDKPVTFFAANPLPEEISVEEHNCDQGEQDKDYVAVSIDKSKLRFTDNNRYKNDFSQLWKHWKKRHTLSGSTFSLIHEITKYYDLFHLVNKPLVRKALQEHYHTIAQCIKSDFSIDKVMDEIDDLQSFFWTHIMNADYGHVSVGLLFGYGLHSATEFEKFINDKNAPKEVDFNQPPEDLLNAFSMPEVSVMDLPLPVYRVFIDPDPVLEHYKQERARIQKEYKDVDLRKLFIEAFKK